MPDNMLSQTISRLVIAAMMLSMLALVSCRRQIEDVDPEGGTQELKVDGLELRITTPTQNISSSEMFEVTLQVRHDPAYQIQLPEIPEKFGSFFVFETHSSPPRLDKSGWVELKRVYTLEPDLPGVSEVPAFLVTAKDPQGKPVEVSSKPMTVTVISVLVDGEKNLKDIAPDTRPVTTEPIPRWPIALLLANVLVVGCLLVVWRKWRRSRASANDDLAWMSLLIDDAGEVDSLKMEPVLARVLASHYGLDLQAIDFQGLVTQLQVRNITVPGLEDAIEDYNRLQYAEHEPTDAEIMKLYHQFDLMISALPGKENVS